MIEYEEYYNAPIVGGDEMRSQHEQYYNANGFAHPKLAVVTQAENVRGIELMQWGLLPPTTWRFNIQKAMIHSNNTLNAKSETIHEVKSFKDNINRYRCILPVEGFFEYKHEEKDKLPFFIHPKAHPYFNLACLYSNYQDPDTKEWIKSFSIVTGQANELMTDIHNSKYRQPIILSDESISAWLDPKTEQKDIDFLMTPCDDSEMAAYRVHRDLQKLGNIPTALEKIAV